jgi:uncharacterized protein (TIRG00374 family)
VSPPQARRLAVGAVLGLGLLALFLHGLDFKGLRAAFGAADARYLAGIVLATVAGYLARAWRWARLLSPVARAPYGRLISATLIGFMTGLIIPRAGEVVRPYLIARRHAVPTAAAFASIIVERLLDLITVLFLFGLYLYVLPAPAAQVPGPLLGRLKAGGAVVGALTVVALAALLALHLRGERALVLLDALLRPLPARVARGVSQAARSFAGGLAVLHSPPSLFLILAAQSLLVWLPIALGVHWANRAFGLDLPFHAAFLILGFLTVGVAVPTPGMVGGFHESYLLALTQAFGVDRETAAAAGIASHAFTNIPVLVLGLLCLWREGLTLGGVARISAGDAGATDADGGRAPASPPGASRAEARLPS